MKTLTVVGLALAPAFAFGDNSAAPSSNTTDAELNPVVVTGTRTPVEKANALSQTIVIDRSQIAQSQAYDVGQILQQYAGLDVVRSGGPGQPASLLIRGGNSNYSVVLIDGVRVNDGVSGEPLISYIAPEIVERIEVIEGPLSTLYGSDAVSGVVNIITRKPGPNQLDAEFGGGSLNTVQGGASLRGQGDVGGYRWGAALSAQQLHSSGIPTFAGAAQSSQYRNQTISGDATLQLGGLKLEARAWDTQGESPFLEEQFDCQFNPAPGFTVCDEAFLDRILALSAGGHFTSDWYSELTLSHSEDRLNSVSERFFSRTQRPEADWHNVLSLDGNNRLSFGALARHEHDDSLGSTVYHEKDDHDYGYIQDEANNGRHHAVAALSYLHDGVFGERFDWNAQYGYDLFEHTRLIAGAGTAFHTPTALDLYYPGDSNPNLRPEKAQDYEVAVKQGLDVHQDLELRLFRNDVRDLITLLGILPVNVGRARLEGVQLDWSFASQDWNARLGGILQDPRNLNTGRELQQTARMSLSAQLNRHLGRYELGAAFFTSGRRADENFNSFPAMPITDGGYSLLDLTAGVRLTGRLRFDVRGTNVLNHHYQTIYSYNQPGSGVYVTLRYLLPL